MATQIDRLERKSGLATLQAIAGGQVSAILMAMIAQQSLFHCYAPRIFIRHEV